MSRIGILIPEFPVQTHAFFIRERKELKKLGIESILLSTKKPVGQEGAATHEWAEAAEKETYYLFPLTIVEIITALLAVIVAGPISWVNCCKIVLQKGEFSVSERLKQVGLILVAAKYKTFCKNNNIDHVHIHSCANSANIAMYAKLLKGPNYSLTLHGPMCDYGTNQKNKWKYASFGIVITKDLKDELQTSLGLYLPPVYLAPMGVDIEKFKRSAPLVAEKNNRKIKLIACGRLNYVKAHDDLIRVVSELKIKNYPVELKICGAMDAPSQLVNYKKELEDLAEKLDVKEEIIFMGSISEEILKKELENSDIFCLASLKEPLGVATMEAMAMGVPTIVTRSPGVMEMIDDGVDGILVEPRNPNMFVEKIMQLMSDDDYRKRLSNKGRQKIVSQFHSGVSAEKIYKGLTSEEK